MTNEVRIRVTADGSQAKSEMGHVKNIMEGVLARDLVRGGLDAMVKGLKSAWSAGMDTIRVSSQLNAVIASTGGAAGITAEQAKGLAEEMQSLTKYEDEAVLGAENLLLTFTNIRGDKFKEATQAVLDMSTAMGQDLSSSAIQVGKALNDPLVGMTALQRVGVTFSESQKDVIKKMTETGDIAGAQALILAELNREFGGSAEAMTPFEKRMDAVTDALHEGQEAIGLFLIGGLDKISAWIEQHSGDIADFANKFSGAFNAIKEHVETHIGGVIAVIENVGTIISGVVETVTDLAHGRWREAWRAFKDTAIEFAKLMVNNIAVLFGAIPNLLIDAVNEGIRKLNDIKIPEKIGASIFGIGGSVPIPGGGGGLGIPEVPRVPTKPFDIGGLIKDIGESADTAAGPLLRIPPAFEAIAAKAKSIADILSGGMGALSGMQGALGSPTKEMAGLQLQLAQIDMKIANRGALAGPNLHDLTPAQQALADAQARGAGAQELKNLQLTVDLNEKHNAALGKTTDVLELQRQALQKEIGKLEALHTVQDAQLVLANQTLLSEDQRATATTVLIGWTETLSGRMEKLANAIFGGPAALVSVIQTAAAALRELDAAARGEPVPAGGFNTTDGLLAGP